MAQWKKGSDGRRKARERVAALHQKVCNIRRTHAHQQSAALVARYDLVAGEDLNVRGMARSRHAIGREIERLEGRDARWKKDRRDVARVMEMADATLRAHDGIAETSGPDSAGAWLEEAGRTMEIERACSFLI